MIATSLYIYGINHSVSHMDLKINKNVTYIFKVELFVLNKISGLSSKGYHLDRLICVVFSLYLHTQTISKCYMLYVHVVKIYNE